MFGGYPPLARNIKYARMYHFKKKNSKIFSPAQPHENVWGPRENVSLGFVVALDGSLPNMWQNFAAIGPGTLGILR